MFKLALYINCSKASFSKKSSPSTKRTYSPFANSKNIFNESTTLSAEITLTIFLCSKLNLSIIFKEEPLTPLSIKKFQFLLKIVHKCYLNTLSNNFQH